jgi:hypothetical protein
MSKTIKQGDIVTCIDTSGFDMGHLTEGRNYIVEWVEGANIKLHNVEYTTKVWRFKLAGEGV